MSPARDPGPLGLRQPAQIDRAYARAAHTGSRLLAPDAQGTAAAGFDAGLGTCRGAREPRRLYACMIIMPLAGYVASNFSKYGVKFFNAVLLPPWGIEDPRIYEFFKGVHRVTSYVFVALIALHVLAAVRHLVLRDGVFGRMWPGRTG